MCVGVEPMALVLWAHTTCSGTCRGIGKMSQADGRVGSRGAICPARPGRHRPRRAAAASASGGATPGRATGWRRGPRADCKPGSVPPVTRGRWPSLWDAGYPAPLATETRGLSEQPTNALLFGLAPGGVCLAGRSPGRRWALTPPFHPYRRRAGGVISVALSFGSPRLGVTQRPALRSPDFPPRLLAKAERPPVRLGPR